LQHALHEHSCPFESSQIGVVVVVIISIGVPINFSIANVAVETFKSSVSAPWAAALKEARAPPAAAGGTTDTTVGGGEPVAPRSADMTADPVVESTSTAPSTAARAMVVKVARECIVQQCRGQCGGKGQVKSATSGLDCFGPPVICHLAPFCVERLSFL
jgi:hypothetical protein